MSAKKTATKTEFLGTGRRKTANARVRITPGSGNFTINGKKMEEYCFTDQLQKSATAPLKVVEMTDSLDVSVSVEGSGSTGQSEAIAHGIARALEKMNPDLRVPLKKAGHLRRDPRAKERKKSGQPGARKRFQFSKR